MSVKKFLSNHITLIEWLIGGAAIMLPIVAWLGNVTLNKITLYDIFPPLGLIAFGLMWTHFVMGALRRYSSVGANQRDLYMNISMGLVLGLIILHPALLWLALYKDGYGLPPFSYMDVYQTQLGFLALGTFGLLIFLAYELKRFFGSKKWWKYVDAAQILGMGVIFVHAIGLGNELRLDWFMALWVFYGLTLAGSIIYSKLIYVPKEESNGTK